MKNSGKLFDQITRETDIKGWYCENRTIGIVYTDMSSQNDLILKKVKDGLKKVFGHSIPHNAFIKTYLYPEDLGKETSREAVDSLDASPTMPILPPRVGPNGKTHN